MGVADRQYFQRPVGGGFFDSCPGSGSVCKKLIAANVIVFLLQIFLTRPMTIDDLRSRLGDRAVDQEQSEDFAQQFGGIQVSLVEDWCQLDTTKVLHGQVWRLITAAFCHERLGVWHILVNMLFLWWFGKTLESMYGSREFLLFYLAGALVASISFVALQLVTGDRVPCIGASGAVMAVVMLYAIHFPRERICVFMLIPIEIRWLVLIYLIVDLHPVLLALSGDKTFTGVAHAAHLGGLAFGFFYWRQNLRLEPLWNRCQSLLGRGAQQRSPSRPRWQPTPPATTTRWRWPRWFGSRRNIRLFNPQEPDGHLDGLVDKLLIKIHEQGEESLTDVERDLLRIAGDRYRSKKGVGNPR